VKTNEELERLAETFSKLINSDDPEDRKRWVELVKPLTRLDIDKLIAIHERRAKEIAAGQR
jgi:hypothetical protein